MDQIIKETQKSQNEQPSTTPGQAGTGSMQGSMQSTPPASPTPASIPPAQQTPPKNNTPLLLIIIIIITVILGIIIFTMFPKSDQSPPIQTLPTQAPFEQTNPSPTEIPPTLTEEEEVDQVEIESATDIDSAFEEIEQDLEQLQ